MHPFFQQAVFEKSYTKPKDKPLLKLGEHKEFAFIGRSNVGKSSLINALCHQNKLAKTSSQPGKTATINFFRFPSQDFLVDLPGYGYAKTSQKNRAAFKTMIDRYILESEQLYCLFILLDLRIKPQAIDLEFINIVGQAGIPIHLLFTKADKLKPQEKQKNLKAYKKSLSESWDEMPPFTITSSVSKEGIAPIQTYILDLIEKG